MKNILICKNCGHENPYYGLICKNCKSYMRERIFNIDLWNILALLIENPVKAFSIIIQSEHKNFILTISMIASIKLFIDSMFLSLAGFKTEPYFGHFIRNYFIVFASVFIVTAAFSYIFTRVNKSFGLITRFRDNFSILIYSFSPHALALILLMTVELTIFGGNIFSNNPSPFTIKTLLAYTMLGFEILIILWSIFLAIIGIYTQTKNFLYSLITGIIFSGIIYSCLAINSNFLYNLNI